MNDEKRTAVIVEARSWLLTPYRHAQALKGAGCDCAGFPRAVYVACGLIPKEYRPTYYPMDWHLHHGHAHSCVGPEGHDLLSCPEERYIQEVLRFASPVNEPSIGDFVLFQFGRAYAHGAIVIAWPSIIHSSRLARSVVYGNAVQDGEIKGRKHLFFSLR